MNEEKPTNHIEDGDDEFDPEFEAELKRLAADKGKTFNTLEELFEDLNDDLTVKSQDTST